VNAGRQVAYGLLVPSHLETYSTAMLLALTKGKIIAAIVFSFFLLCVALPGVAQNLDLEMAKKSYADNAYNCALMAFRISAKAGMKEAQYWLGLLHDRGHGVGRDSIIALQWFKKSAEQGHAETQRGLGVYLEEGVVIDQDLAAAANWYSRAAEQKNAKGLRNLAQLYVWGRGVDRDFGQAAESGNADAQLMLSRIDILGAGVKQDPAKALFWALLGAMQKPDLAEWHFDKLREQLKIG